tara:strand:+ start:383 stop:763 length:381 start_codon:yes stop_codon:yes gene_type:complete
MPSTSLTDIYSGLVSAERDQMEKAAAAGRQATTTDDMVKVASAYDGIGRAMARQYVDDMVKAAMEEGATPEAIEAAGEELAEEPEEEELARRKAEILAKLQAEGDDGEMPPELAEEMQSEEEAPPA